jgi:alkylation response protein AidB-like acyl-CoA dehydrogenase
VGGVGNGWSVAITTLMNERAGLAFFLQVGMRRTLDRLIAELKAQGRLDDPVVQHRAARLRARTDILRLTAYRGLSAIQRGGEPGPEGSLTKWMWSRTNQDIAQFAVETLGPDALASDSGWSFDLLRARGNTIEGGTTEILKSIVAERVLGLPKGR